MACGKNHLVAALHATTDAERARHVKAFTGPIFEEMRERRAAGVCAECEEPVADREGDAIADTYCVAHAREVELEFLIADQEYDD